MFPPLYEYVFAAFAFVLGSAIGSFLNVCIYRMPLGKSVNEPKRSYCPSCEYQIPFYHNLPLISWLVLRGKCANCGARISFRYFGVEFLTALLVLAVWLKVWSWGQPGWPAESWMLAVPYWIMVSLFIVATFIDSFFAPTFFAESPDLYRMLFQPRTFSPPRIVKIPSAPSTCPNSDVLSISSIL